MDGLSTEVLQPSYSHVGGFRFTTTSLQNPRVPELSSEVGLKRRELMRPPTLSLCSEIVKATLVRLCGGTSPVCRESVLEEMFRSSETLLFSNLWVSQVLHHSGQGGVGPLGTVSQHNAPAFPATHP